jgi:hypothetical protein
VNRGSCVIDSFYLIFELLSAVASQAITSIFSATYDNYLILVYGGTASTPVGVSLTLGATSTPIYESGSAFIGIGAISSSLVSRLQVYRSGSNASVLKVDGGSGTLFEVTDNLSGSLFSVNTIAGFPILEVFSNNRIVAGAYGTNALVVSASSVGIGIATPSAKLHIQGNISGSQFTSSRRNAVGFFGTSSYARNALSASYLIPTSNNTTKAIFGYGYTSAAVSMVNLVSNIGVVANDVTGVGSARHTLAATGYGTDKAIFGYGFTSAVVSITNLVSFLKKKIQLLLKSKIDSLVNGIKV